MIITEFGNSFYPSLFTPAVNKNDARFVDILHTDAWLYGIPIATGFVLLIYYQYNYTNLWTHYLLFFNVQTCRLLAQQR